MLIEDVMQRSVVTAKPSTTLGEAWRELGRRGIRHLPVVDAGKLVGIVSDRDLKRRDFLERLTIGEIMTRAVVTIAPMFPVEEAARIMVTKKISALPVTEADRLVGIVTETDVLGLFVTAMGAGEPSSRLDVTVGAERSALAEIVAIVEGVGAPISSIVTLGKRDGPREVVLRVATINPIAAVRALEAKGYTVRSTWRGRAEA